MVVLWKANPKCVQNLIAFISGRAREKEEEQRQGEGSPLAVCLDVSLSGQLPFYPWLFRRPLGS